MEGQNLAPQPRATPVAAELNAEISIFGQFSYVGVVSQLHPPQGLLLDPGHYVIAAGGLTFFPEDNDLMPMPVRALLLVRELPLFRLGQG